MTSGVSHKKLNESLEEVLSQHNIAAEEVARIINEMEVETGLRRDPKAGRVIKRQSRRRKSPESLKVEKLGSTHGVQSVNGFFLKSRRRKIAIILESLASALAATVIAGGVSFLVALSIF